MNDTPTPETDVIASMRRTIQEWREHSEKLERERDHFAKNLGEVREILCDAIPHMNQPTPDMARILTRTRDEWKDETKRWRDIAANATSDRKQADTDSIRALHERNELREKYRVHHEEAERLTKENNELRRLNIEAASLAATYATALHQIANADYCGNRSHESQIAFRALNP